MVDVSNLPPLNHDDLGQIDAMLAKLKRMQKREHHHRDPHTVVADSIGESIKELVELREWLESRI